MVAMELWHGNGWNMGWQQQWAWPGQHRATCSLSPIWGRWPEASFQSSTAIQGLPATLGVRTSTIYLGWALHLCLSPTDPNPPAWGSQSPLSCVP